MAELSEKFSKEYAAAKTASDAATEVMRQQLAIEVDQKIQKGRKETEENFNKRLDEQVKIQLDEVTKRLQQLKDSSSQNEQKLQKDIDELSEKLRTEFAAKTANGAATAIEVDQKIQNHHKEL